ncbi:hypothetical protein JL722_6671 [Aureococcus anophagefferens]|nr:hypothetical protein JL722_6671 [Aureococcus anophagefferens]
MDAADDLACDLEFFACAQRARGTWSSPTRRRPRPGTGSAFVLAMALDAKYAAWRERADELEDDDDRVDWRLRSRHGVGGVPSLVLFPLCFGSLVLALSLRLGLVFLYLRVSAALLGTADGPVDIIVDCLTLVFVLELDNLMRLAGREKAPISAVSHSRLDASRTLFGRARASANDRARHLGAKLRAIAAATLDAGTSGRRAEARCEHACVVACVVALAGLVLLAACRMQRVTARGDVTVPGDPDRDAMAAALHWVSKAMIVVVAALVCAEFNHCLLVIETVAEHAVLDAFDAVTLAVVSRSCRGAARRAVSRRFGAVTVAPYLCDLGEASRRTLDGRGLRALARLLSGGGGVECVLDRLLGASDAALAAFARRRTSRAASGSRCARARGCGPRARSSARCRGCGR